MLGENGEWPPALVAVTCLGSLLPPLCHFLTCFSVSASSLFLVLPALPPPSSAFLPVSDSLSLCLAPLWGSLSCSLPLPASASISASASASGSGSLLGSVSGRLSLRGRVAVPGARCVDPLGPDEGGCGEDGASSGLEAGHLSEGRRGLQRPRESGLTHPPHQQEGGGSVQFWPQENGSHK